MSKRQPNEGPGWYLIWLANRSPPCRTVLEHIGWLQILYDHYNDWHEAQTTQERNRIKQRMRRQLARSLAVFGSFEVGSHGLVYVAMGEFAMGASLMAVGIALVYALTHKG